MRRHGGLRGTRRCKLEARSEAEEATANAFFEADQREAEHEQRRILSLEALDEGEEAGLEMFEEDK